ncbi:hypothetical protein RJ640_013039 [Escallonia rubra]|uniref:WRKY domain-containing protein n=1 Tax=Escallonia rubra TaxID=112253 RepID=A0AA88RL12_9ASTE|nr:hypothetical protein RJ640_013039 [Escallonia rubra]
MDHPNPNPNPKYTPEVSGFDVPEFQLSDYLMLEDGSEEDFSTQTLVSSEINEAEVKRNKEDSGNRVAFITKSELETMDDGFSWRKYGKKRVKNSPYPRIFINPQSEDASHKFDKLPRKSGIIWAKEEVLKEGRASTEYASTKLKHD